MKLPIYSGAYVPSMEQLSAENIAKIESMNSVLADANIAYDSLIREYPKLKAAFKDRRNELSLADVKLTTRALTQLEARKNYLFWLDETSSYLNKEDSWVALRKLVDRKAKKRFESIKQEWIQGHETAHFTADALMSIATDVLPNYQIHIQLVEQEFKYKSKSLTEEQRADIAAYIQSGKDFIDRAQLEIAQGMVAWLKMASKGNSIEAESLVVNTIKSLQAINVIKDININANTQPRLKPEQFLFFHQYIDTHQPRTLKEASIDCSWLNGASNLYGTRLGGEYIIAPKALYSRINASRFRRAFDKALGLPDAKDFSQRYQLDLVRIELLTNKGLRLDDSNIESKVKLLEELNSKLLCAKQQMHARKPKRLGSILPFIFNKRIKTYKAVLESSYAQAQELAFEALHAELNLWSRGGESPGWSKKKATHFERLNKLVCTARYRRIIDAKSSQYLIIKGENRINGLLDDILEGELGDDGYLEPLFEYAQRIKECEPKWSSFQVSAGRAIDYLSYRITTLLKRLSESDSSISKRESDDLGLLLTVFSHLADKKQYKVIEGALYNLMVTYHQSFKVSNPDVLWATQVENVLHTYNKTLGFDEQAKLIAMIARRRKKGGDEFLSELHKLSSRYGRYHLMVCEYIASGDEATEDMSNRRAVL